VKLTLSLTRQESVRLAIAAGVLGHAGWDLARRRSPATVLAAAWGLIGVARVAAEIREARELDAGQAAR
jgi:hypothetical protein